MVPDTITVEVELERTVQAERAELLVHISGSSQVSGDTALKKAAEVRGLVEALSRIGIGDDRIRVDGISASTSSGIIGKSSFVNYSLRIELPSLEKLTEAIGVVASRKNASLDQIRWHYDGMEVIRHEMLTEAISQAQARSALISRELGQRVDGIHSFQESLRDDYSTHGAFEGMPSMGAASGAALMSSSDSVDLGMEVSHLKRVVLRVLVQYRVSPLEK